MTHQRPSDAELYQLLMSAHGYLHQHAPLSGSHRPNLSALMTRLQAAWEGLEARTTDR